MDYNLKILIEAALNEGKSIRNINSTLKSIQKQVKSLNINMTFDYKVVEKLASAGKGVTYFSDQLKKQVDNGKLFNSETKKSTDAINKETKAMLDAVDASKKWKLEQEKLSKQGIITQKWGNSENNTKKQVVLDANSNRIDTPYQQQSSNFAKDKADLDKLANQRASEANARQTQYEANRVKAIKEQKDLTEQMFKARMQSEGQTASRIKEMEANQASAIKKYRAEADAEAKQRMAQTNARQAEHAQQEKARISEENSLLKAMYSGRESAEKQALSRANAWEKQQIQAINAVRTAQEQASAKQQTKEQQINNWWLKALKDRETQEINSIANAQKKREAYSNWWLKAISAQERAEQQSAKRSADAYNNFWQKAIANKRITDAKTLDSLNGKATLGNAKAMQGVSDISTIESINKKYVELRNEITRLKTSGQELTTAQVNGIKAQINALTQLGQKQREAEALVRQQIKAQQEVTRISNTYGKNVDKTRLNELLAQINALNTSSANFKARASQLSQEIKLIGDNARVAATGAKTLGESLGNAFKNMALYAGAGSLFFGVIQTMRNMIDTIVEVDGQLTQMKRVMDESTDFNGLMASSIDMANEFGRSIQDVNENLIGFARMGFNEEDTVALAGVATLFQNISDLTPTEAIDSMTAAMINFNISASDAMDIADKINEVDNNFAVTSQDLALSINKAGASARTYGLTLEQLIGVTTAIGTATRESGNVVGNSIKSIVSRVTTLPKAINALEKVGVSVNKANGEQKDAYDILGELAGKWSSLTKEQQRNTAIQVAGTYQVTRLNAVLQNWQIGINATNSALNASGSAMTENEKYMNSLQARIERMKTAWATLTIAFGNAVISDSIVLITTLLSGMANVITPFVNVLGGIPVAIGLITGALYLTIPAFRGFVGSLYSTIAGLVTYATVTGVASGASAALAVAVNLAKVALRGLLIASGVGLAFAALGFILEKVINLFADTSSVADSTQSSMEKLNETVGNLGELRSLSKEYETLSNRTKLTGEEKTRLAQIEQTLADKQGIVLSSAENQTQAYSENAKAIKDRIQLLESQAEAERKIAEADYRKDSYNINENIKTKTEELKELTEEYKSAEANYRGFQQAVDEGGSVTNRGREFGLGAMMLGSPEQVQKALDKLATEYENGKTEVGSKQNELQQEINKRSAGLRGEFERQNQIFESQGKTVSDNTRKYAQIYADLASSFTKTNDLDIGKGYAKVFDDLQNVDLSKADDIKEFFRTLSETGEIDANINSQLDNLFANLNVEQAVEGVEDFSESLDQAREALSDFFEELDNHASDVAKLNQVLYDLTKGESLSGEQMYELIRKYPELAGHIKRTAEGWTIEKSAVKNLRDAKIQLLKTDVESQKAMAVTTVNATLQRLKMYGLEIKAIKNVQDAMNAKNKVEMSADSEINDNSNNFNATPNQPFSSAFVDALNNRYPDEAKKLKDKLVKDSSQTKEDVLTAINSFVGTNEELEKQLKDIVSTVSSPDYGVSKDKDKTEDKLKDKEKKVKEVNDTIKETVEVLTATQNKLMDLEKQLNKVESARYKLIKGSKEYRQSLEKENAILDKQIETYAKAKPEDLLATKITTTQTVPQGTTVDGGDIAPANMTNNSAVSSLISNARNLQGNFKYQQIGGEFKGSYDQFVKKGISDCSQFVQEMYKQFLNTKLPRTAAEQAKTGTAVSKDNLQAGDLVFWNTTGKANSHVGVYTENGKAIQMGNHGLKEISLDAISNYEGARRIVSTDQANKKSNVDTSSPATGVTTTTKSVDGKTTVKKEAPTNEDLRKAEDERIEGEAKARQQKFSNQMAIAEDFIDESKKVQDKIETQIKASERKQTKYSVDSSEYRKEAQVQSSLISQQQKNLENTNKKIKEYAKSQGLSEAYFSEMLNNNSSEWLDLNDAKLSKSQVIVDSYLTNYKNKLDDVTKALDMSSAKMALMDEGSVEYNKELSNQIPLLEKQQDLYEAQAKYIDAQLDNTKLEKSYRDQLLSDREQLSKEWWNTVNAIKEINDQLRKLKEERVDNIIEDMKNVTQKQKDVALKAIDDEKTAEDERHKKRTKNIEKESNDFKKYINDRISAYERENKSQDYDSDLGKAIKERDKIQQQLDNLSLNDSASAIKKKKELNEQLATANENITKMQTDRERDLVVQGLNDQLSTHDEYTNKEKENEDDSYELFNKNLDNRKKKTEQSYDDILNNEKKYYDLKKGLMSSDKAVVNSTIEEIKGFYDGLFTYMNDASLGTSQAFENMSYTIQKALEKVTKYSGGDYSAVPTTDTKTTPATDIANNTQKEKENKAWSTYVNNKKQAEDTKNKMSKLKTNSAEYKALEKQFNTLKASNDKMRSEFGFVDYSYDILSRLQAPAKIEKFAKIERFKTGGGTGNWAGEEGKLAVVDKKEAILNQADTSNLVKAVEIVNGIMQKTRSNAIINPSNNNDVSQGDTYVSMDFRGSKFEDGTDFANKTIKTLENQGLKLRNFK